MKETKVSGKWKQSIFSRLDISWISTGLHFNKDSLQRCHNKGCTTLFLHPNQVNHTKYLLTHDLLPPPPLRLAIIPNKQEQIIDCFV